MLIPKGPDGIDMTTGMTAVHIAIHDGHTKIYLLGFDTTYVGKDKQYNHVYAGTNAYGPKTVDEDHSGFFAIRMFDFFNHFQNINFIRVGGKTVDMFAKCKNFTQLTYKEMADI